MRNLKYRRRSGQVEARDLLITAAATLGLAIIIVGAFIIWSGRRAPGAPGGAGPEAPAAGQRKAGGPAGAAPEAANGEETKKPSQESYQGVLMAAAADKLTVNDAATGKEITVILSRTTVIEYNGKPFAKSRFYTGDQLAIVGLTQNKQVLADKITVLVSASPSAPAPVPGPGKADIRPDGSIKPL